MSATRWALAVCFGLGCTPSSSPAHQATPKAHAPSNPPSPSDACPHAESPDALRLPYEAFGPPAMAYALLGQAWWQWDIEGHAFEEDGGTVWVVVHDGVQDRVLAQRFPVRPEAQCDHRYVELGAARAYLDANIAELSDASEFEHLHSTLQATRQSLSKHFE